jgi:hypothetical protein
MKTKKIYKSIHLKYDRFFKAHLLDKPIYSLNDLKMQVYDEKCIHITNDKVIVRDVFDHEPIDVIKDDIRFYKLDDRNIYISLELFLKDNEYPEDKRYSGDWGYQLVLIDKGDKYLLDYQDGFITGSYSNQSDDFQILTSDWQW